MDPILIVGSFGKPWNTAHYLVHAAEKIGHRVSTFDPLQAGATEEMLMKRVEESRPTYMLIMKGTGFKPEWNEALKEKGIYTILWHPDPDIPDWLLPLIRSVDFCFTMAEGMIPEWKEKGAKQVAWLSQGFEPAFFEAGPITDMDLRFYGADVAFVGNIDSTNNYLTRRYKLKRILREGFHLKWWGPRLGRKLINLPILLSSIGRAYGGRFIYGPEFAKVALCSKVFLAFDRETEIRLSMSARMYTAVGCGAFYMCEAMDGIESVLTPGKEIVTFKGEEEMIDKIRYYLPRESEREQIARAGQGRVQREHTYQRRLEQMFRTVKGAPHA
ncbi:CgeB family protein [Candidatus Manganitrophus noduliformans]|uniref:Glycosyltransferase n=1 Tax=Candidatus Manganitrophus noduliformans TaxID=2606439 RepID=A0A7X6IAQ8_9BACT|nr:glycosyltransferase [Candidatus Manganitrophus noduliformans]NKE70976.1 glycosyltransferase [Candidatus Manganitrophus noduliformans]